LANDILKSIKVPHIPKMGFERMEEHLNQTGTLEILRLIEDNYRSRNTKEAVPQNEMVMTMQNFQPEAQSQPKTSSRKQAV